jgi:hypothetical protein
VKIQICLLENPYKYWLLMGLSALCLTVMLGVSGTAQADSDEDLQLWSPVFLTVPVSEKWKLALETQPRFKSNITELGQMIVRPSIGYQLTPKFSLWQGYAYTPQFNPHVNVQNIWQQAVLETHPKAFTLRNRLRLEERFIQDVSGTPLRLRHQFYVLHPIGKSKKWGLVGSNEVFLNLNSHNSGPQSGLDQNRLYAGISRQINKKIRAEGGYLLQYINRPSPVRNNLNHVIMLSLYMTL